MTYFTYNGRSSADFGLHIEKKDVFSAPEYDAEFISIPGRSGDIINPNRRFSNIKVCYTVFLARKNTAALADVLRNIKGWLYYEPFKYSLEGQQTVAVDASELTITNPTAFESRPYIKIYGSGLIRLMVQPEGEGASLWTISEVDECIETDSEHMNCFKDTTLKNDTVTGDGFPMLKPGTTTIACAGNVRRVEVVPRWQCL